jgi:hypothetical protein
MTNKEEETILNQNKTIQEPLAALEQSILRAMAQYTRLCLTKTQNKQRYAQQVYGTEYKITPAKGQPYCSVPKLHFYLDMTGATTLTGRDNELVNIAVSKLIIQGQLIELRSKSQGDRLVALPLPA